MFTKFCSSIIIISLTVFVSGCEKVDKAKFEYKVQPSCEDARDVLVGVNYYAGWWPSTPEIPNKWHDFQDKHNWLEDYPERTPILGIYNDQETMDKEIIAASDNGVDFFIILWYPWPKDLTSNQYHSPKLNDGIKYFTESKQADRMKFCIEICNHMPFHFESKEHWLESIDLWIEAMKHPGYLTVGGRKVIKIHFAEQMYKDTGRDFDKLKEWIDLLRDKAEQAGVGELCIGIGEAGPMVWDGHWVQKFFDFTSDYMKLPDFKPTHIPQPYPYNWLSYYHIQLRGSHQFDDIPYMPVLPAGWDPRPWREPDVKPVYKNPDRQEWERELKWMAYDLRTSPELGIPLPDGSTQKAFTIYAWNEFGEGSYVAPTQGESYMKLEGIKKIFGVKKCK